MEGASIRISPSWVPDLITLDMAWDPNLLSDPSPTGPWWSPLALLGRTGSQEGEWEWVKADRNLLLWVRAALPPPDQTLSFRRLIGWLSGFDLPAMTGATGMGALSTMAVPVVQPVAFNWIVNPAA